MLTINSAEGGSALDLPGAAVQFFDATMWVTLGAALLVSTTAFVVMRLYVRSVFRESQRSAPLPQAGLRVEEGPRLPLLSAIGPPEIQPENSGGPGSPSRVRSSTFQHAETAFHRAARVYALGGSIHAAISVALLFVFGIYSLPSTSSRLTVLACYVAVFWSWFFTTIVALALFCGPDRRLRALLILGYLGTLPMMGVLLQLAGAPAIPFADLGLMSKDEAALVSSLATVVMRQPVTAATVTFSPLIQPILFWSLSAAPLTIPLLAFNRLIRGTVGPLFITLALMLVPSTFVIVDLVLYTSAGIKFAGHVKGILGGSTYAVLMVTSLTLSAVIALFGLLWIARRYRRRQLSDQTFLFDALWLSVSFWVTVYLMGNHHQFRARLRLSLQSAFYSRRTRGAENRVRLANPPARLSSKIIGRSFQPLLRSL